MNWSQRIWVKRPFDLQHRMTVMSLQSFGDELRMEFKLKQLVSIETFKWLLTNLETKSLNCRC